MTNAGATDIFVALKQRVLDAAPIVHDFSIQGSTKFPTGAHGVGTETTDLSLLLISGGPIGAGELDLNAGYTHRSCDGVLVPTSATLLTASFGTPIRGLQCAELWRQRRVCGRDVQCRPNPWFPGTAPPVTLLNATERFRFVVQAGLSINPHPGKC